MALANNGEVPTSTHSRASSGKHNKHFSTHPSPLPTTVTNRILGFGIRGFLAPAIGLPEIHTEFE
jgi:hypothetical protein